MAKKRSARRSSVSGGRDTFAIANRRLPRPGSTRFTPRVLTDDFLRAVQDYRTWSPSTVLDSRTVKGGLARLRVSSPRAKARRGRPVALLEVPPAVAFRAPKTVIVCIRRQARKEVLHALGVAGGRVGRPHRGVFSSVSCKRR